MIKPGRCLTRIAETGKNFEQCVREHGHDGEHTTTREPETVPAAPGVKASAMYNVTPAKAQNMLRDLSNEALSMSYDEAVRQLPGKEISMVLDWIGTELELRMGTERYEAWLMDFSGKDGNPVPAIGYLNRK
jgi:hypothetical protein